MMTPKILFFAAALFASAAVGYPANEIDWGKGRPGVRVVTNAPSRAEFDALVSGNSQYASVAAIASNANYSSVSALASNALTAVSVTGQQSNDIANAASVAYVDTLAQTNRVKTVWDNEDANVFTRWENSTGITYRISYDWHADFNGTSQYIVAGMPYPLTEGTWGDFSVSESSPGLTNVYYIGSGVNVDDLYAVSYSWGDVSLRYFVSSNSITRLLVQSDYDALNSSFNLIDDNVTALSESNRQTNIRIDGLKFDISSNYLYGDLDTTNTPGYAGYTVANGSARSVTLVPVSTITTNTASFEYQIGSNGFVSATAIAQASGVSGTFGSSVMTILDANDVPLASNTFTAGTFTSGAAARPYFTNSLTYAAGFVTNAKLRVSYTMWRTNTSAFAVQLYTGTTYPMILTCKTEPLPYVTFDQSEARYALQTGGTLTNAAFRGTLNVPNSVTFSNGMKLTVGVVLNGTNVWQFTDPSGITNACYPLPW